LETIIRRFILQAILNCHSERSEESLIISGSPPTEISQGCFASLNMTAPFKRWIVTI
jgi:hypothetical protein